MNTDFVKPLLRWYVREHRDLPWRHTRDPYRIWVSEIMLQQTRVEAVKEYYRRFLEELPDVSHLAECPEDRLLKLWEGLGYYSRVRNMKKCAVLLVNEYGGQMPSELTLLRKLPGIGPYTAGAIASIAFGEPVPAVDGNVLRVYARMTDLHENILDTNVKKSAEKDYEEVMRAYFGKYADSQEGLSGAGATAADSESAPSVPETLSVRDTAADDMETLFIKDTGTAENPETLFIKDTATAENPETLFIKDGDTGEDPGTFTQALIELGATVCGPDHRPECGRCPVAEFCLSHKRGTAADLPVRIKKTKRRAERRTVFLIHDGEETAVRKRPDRGLLAGLYEFPNTEGALTENEALEYVRNLGFEPLYIRKMPDAKHLFSHIEWDMTGYEIRIAERTGKGPEDNGQIVFAERQDLEGERAIPSAFKTYAREMKLRVGTDRKVH